MKFLIIGFLLFTLTACKLNGTDVGNPQRPPVDTGLCTKERCLPQSFKVDLEVSVVCQKIADCLQIESPDCTENVSKQDGLNLILNLPVNNYAALKPLVEKKMIEINSSNYNTCLNTISNLSCEDSKFKNAFDIQQPENYTNIHTILLSDESCLDTYFITGE